jgi:2-phospho-L-lactate guanylyltransferase
VRTLAILPVKRFGDAKQRLGELGGDVRRALAEAMLADVLEALARCERVDGTLVVTSEPRAAAIAEEHGVPVIPEPPEPGHSAAAAHGAGHADAEGWERVLMVPIDCPAISPAEIDALLAAPAEDGPSVVVVPDRHGSGTNALLIAPPRAMTPAFGPGSRERHVALARGAGAAARVAPLPSLALDVDTPDDLASLRAALAALPGAAPATQAALDRLLPQAAATSAAQ